MVLSGSRPVFDNWFCDHATRTAVKAHSGCVLMIDDNGLIIGVVDDCRVHARDGRIVDEGFVVPVSTVISVTRVPKAVVDAAIIADVRPPIASMPNVETVAPVIRLSIGSRQPALAPTHQEPSSNLRHPHRRPSSPASK